MTIRFSSKAPQKTEEKLDGWIPEIQFAALAGGGAAGGAVINLSDGYEVRYLGLAGIAEGHLIGATHSKKWRHLVMSGTHPHGELELDDQLDPVALHEGTGKEGLMAALSVADSLTGDFEACVLIAPPIRFIALWLHNDQDDWIIPYPPNATPLVDYKPISIDEALGILTAMAADVLEASAAGQATGG